MQKPIHLDVEGEIRFEHASFGYKSYQPVLEDLNLTIKKGEMIGIVGASGTGKSTIINLIMRLYEVDDGKLLVDGHNIKETSRIIFIHKLVWCYRRHFILWDNS